MSTQKIGIDKLSLVCKDFSVSDALSPYFNLDTALKQNRQDNNLPYLITDASGQRIHAHSMWHNTTQVQLSIHPDKGLNIQFNPDKIIHHYQLSEINSAGFNDAISVVDKHLQKIGIGVNLEQMKLNRVDLAKQHEMSYSVWQYSEAFRVLSAKNRMKKRTYLETFTIGNTQHQVCFYDKQQELQTFGLSNFMSGEKNLLRGEIRYLKSNCTQRQLHSSTLHEFKKLHPADISQYYSQYMNKNIFNSKPVQQELFDFNKDVQLVKYLKACYPNKVLDMFFNLSSIEEKIIIVGGIDNLMKIFTAAGFNRLWINRSRKKIDNLLSLKASIDKKRDKISVSMLLDELKVKFAA